MTVENKKPPFSMSFTSKSFLLLLSARGQTR